MLSAAWAYEPKPVGMRTIERFGSELLADAEMRVCLDSQSPVAIVLELSEQVI
jgi:hypothetical protein